jgi:hypothetical protein
MAETQLVEALDEYAGMSLRDIALAVAYEEDEAQQARAIAAIQSRAPGIGHNRPPIAEQLVEELAPLRARQGAMIATAGQAVIIDDESAAKVTDLSIQVRDLADELKQARDAAMRPYVMASQSIAEGYNALIVPLAATYGDRRTGLRGMIQAYHDKREAEAAAARRKAAAEQRQREEEAAEARRKADAARDAGKGSIAAEIAASAAEDEAAAAGRRATAIRPAPLRSTLGQVSTTRQIAYDFEGTTDAERLAAVRKMLAWGLKQSGVRAVIEADLRRTCGSYLRQLGVDAVEKSLAVASPIPGIKVWIDKVAGVRR